LTLYFIKKLVGALATPGALAVAIAVMAAIFRWRRWWRTATALFVTAMLIGYLGALVPVGNALLWPLERRYPPLRLSETPPTIAYIVVLGSSYAPRAGFPVTAALDEDALVRIVEGVRLAHHFKSARLVVSGGAPGGLIPSAHGYARLASELGISKSAMIVLDHPLDTHAEALAVSAQLGDQPFILTTSAYHMPRAMLHMERAGARPIPAPTGHRARDPLGFGWRAFFPSAAGLRKTELAMHEYLGLSALKLGLE